MSRPRTALLVDPQPIFRAGLAASLRRAGIEVVGEVGDLHEAIDTAAQLRPGICVIDATFPGAALAATKRITAAAPETLVVLIGPYDNTYVVAAVRAGARGYLPRSTSVTGLARAVAEVLDGSAAVPRAGVAALVNELRAGGHRREAIAGAGISLTEREAAAVELLRAGLDTQAIAGELGVSPVTVRRYLSTVARKAGARSREALIRLLTAPS